jgi:hypothetical protein
LAVCDYLQKRHIPLSTSLYLDKKYFKPDTYSPLRDKQTNKDETSKNIAFQYGNLPVKMKKKLEKNKMQYKNESI